MDRAAMAKRIAATVGISVDNARKRIRQWPEARWFELPQTVAGKRPAPASHPWKARPVLAGRRREGFVPGRSRPSAERRLTARRDR